MDNIAFDKASLVSSIADEAIEKNKKVQNTFVRILVEKGGILEDSDGTENVRQVIWDNVYCYPDDKKIDEFIEKIKNYGI